jgi:hypothetical protein
MDPNAAWLALAQAVADDEWETAAEIADNLLTWLARGGFPPTITGLRAFDALAARRACEAVACWDV